MTPLDALLVDMDRRRLAGDRDAALALLDAAPPAARDHPLAHYARGTLLYELGRLPEAEASFRAALASDPSSPDFIVNLALVLVAEQRSDEVRPLLDSVRREDPRAHALAATLAHLRGLVR